jgi:hypothetical protein
MVRQSHGVDVGGERRHARAEETFDASLYIQMSVVISTNIALISKLT